MPLETVLIQDLAKMFLGYIIGELRGRLTVWYRTIRPVSKILGELTQSGEATIIVVPKLYSMYENVKLKKPRNSHEQINWPLEAPLFAEGDATGMTYIFNLLLRAGKRMDELQMKNDITLSGEDKRGNIICVGAGSNSVTREFLNITQPLITFERVVLQKGDYTFIDAFGTAIIDRSSGQMWRIEENYDYGLILKMRNPLNEDRDALILAGLGPAGTAGSAYFLAKYWKKIYQKLKAQKWTGHDYAIVIKTRITDYTDVSLVKVAARIH